MPPYSLRGAPNPLPLPCASALTLHVLPRSAEKGYEEHRVVLGTHTSDSEQNYVMIAKVLAASSPRIPSPTPKCSPQKILPISRCGRADLTMRRCTQIVLPAEGSDCSDGGYRSARVEIVQRIAHEGEVNRARHMPQNTNIVATKAPAAEVMNFDCSKHDAKPGAGSKCEPDMKLIGHEKEGCVRPHLHVGDTAPEPR